jgi:ABC-type transport system substrate-binding protein
MGGIKTKDYYLNHTKLVANFGGTYHEAIVGESHYLNPILAASDPDKSVSSLIFSSLFKFDKNGSILPDVAEKWDISADKLVYTVTLRNDVFFHDGEKLTAADIVYTAQTIQDPVFKSPLYETWKDIKIEQAGENIVTFTLPKAYGPFIYTLDFGILPLHLTPDELAQKVIGSGPYKYDDSKKNGDKITRLTLKSNTKYYAGRPYLNKLQFDFFDTKDLAKTGFGTGQNYQALSGMSATEQGFSDFSFPTSKELVLVPNLRVDKFKDKNFRAQVLSSDQAMPTKTSINLATADSELQRNKAEELKKSFAARNIELNITYFKPTEMKDILDKKDFELLLFGFDFGHDRDPYIFWHSSQIDKMNYAGYSDKKSDILLEDARMISDATQRNAAYDQFYATIKSESLAIYFEPVTYYEVISNSIKNVDTSTSFDSGSKYLSEGKWYVKEKRVRK